MIGDFVLDVDIPVVDRIPGVGELAVTNDQHVVIVHKVTNIRDDLYVLVGDFATPQQRSSRTCWMLTKGQ